VFYYADEFNLSWFPTLRAMWSPKGQQVMIPTPGQPDKYYGIGAVNYHTGESVVQFQRRKRRQEIAQLLEALVAKHPTGTIYVAWDNASMHEDAEVEAVVRAAAGRQVLLYLPTYSPWLNPIEMLWRYFRREVTHCELFETKSALLAAAQACFNRFNQGLSKILSVIGSNAVKVARLYLVFQIKIWNSRQSLQAEAARDVLKHYLKDYSMTGAAYGAGAAQRCT
jgi:transposase